MGRLLTWHTRAGHHGLRLLCLQLLWLAYTLRGAILLGVFPATAAVHAILRADEREHQQDPTHTPELRTLPAQFRQHWHAELGPANRLGALLTLLWAVVLLDRAAVTYLDLGALTPLLAGAHTVGGLVLGVLTVLVWPLQAHFDEGAFALLRRSTVMMLGRPAITLLTALGVGIVLYLYYLLPGLIPVFGTIAPAAIATACLWRTGVLGTSSATPSPVATPAPAMAGGAR
jgi:uncharacterized membrane protein YesL